MPAIKEAESTTAASRLLNALGLRTDERPELFRETADAATDTDLPFFLVLLLSGLIATLGLVLNSTAVVIGAMLVAPLLGPLMGLSLSVAVGDGRLFVQTMATVLVGATAVVALAALVTWALPIDTVTEQIAARTTPNILDLLIAIASGLAGAVVIASRESRLSGSIPGVAVAVALVPPLGVAGFGIGTGLQWSLITGSLLLFGANLAGIVLSGLVVFLLVGMSRAEIVETAARWHMELRSSGLARSCERLPMLGDGGAASSPLKRILLTMGFVALVSLPLAKSFGHYVREVRLNQAADAAERTLEADGRTLVVNRSVAEEGEGGTVTFRVTTQRRVPEDEQTALSNQMTRRTGRRVTLRLVQIVVPSGRLRAAADALPVAPVDAGAASTTADLLTPLEERLAGIGGEILLPPGVRLLGSALTVASGQPPSLEVTYGAATALSPDAEALVAGQASRAVALDPAAARARWVRLGEQPLPEPAVLLSLLSAHPTLNATLRRPERRAADYAGLPFREPRLVREDGAAELRLCVRTTAEQRGCPVPTPAPPAVTAPQLPGPLSPAVLQTSSTNRP